MWTPHEANFASSSGLNTTSQLSSGAPPRRSFARSRFTPTPAEVHGGEAYEQWGGYGSSKAALEHLTAILAAEHPDLRVLVVDPGDMRTEMHQAAFPGEDISDRPSPSTVVPHLVALLESDRPSGRYRLAEVPA